MSASSASGRWWVGLGLAGVLGFGLHQHQQQVEQREQLARLEQQLSALNEALVAVKRAPAPVMPLAPATLPPQAPRGGVDLVATEAVAQRVAELLGARLGAHPEGAASPEAQPQPAPAPSAEQRAAVEQAQRTLEGALSRGRLSRADVEQMRLQLAQSQDAEARRELGRRIIVAINTNALVPEDPHFIIP